MFNVPCLHSIEWAFTFLLFVFALGLTKRHTHTDACSFRVELFNKLYTGIKDRLNQQQQQLHIRGFMLIACGDMLLRTKKFFLCFILR